MLLYYSTLHVFIVRNFLIFLPFIALFAGAGLDQLLRAIHRIELRTAIAVVAFLPFVFGTVVLAQAAETIAHRSTASTVRAAMQWIRQHPNDRFEVTANVAQEAELASTPLPPNADRQPGARYLVFWLSDLRLGPWLQVIADPAAAGGFQPTWTANQRATFRVFGPQEVDFNFYPDWAGDDRILIMPAQQAAQAGVTPDKLFKPATPYCCRVPPRGSRSAFDLAAVWRACAVNDARSVEGGREPFVVVHPPAAPAVVARAATGPVPHRDGVRVAGVDAAPDGCFDAIDGVVHGGEQLGPTVPVQSVGVGDES
jgi:hypothetical protein